MSRSNSRFSGSAILTFSSALLYLLFSLPLCAQAPPSADTFVSSAYPTTNFGSVNSLVVGPSSVSYIQFNLSGIPAGATVTKASLRLYVDLVSKAGKFDVYQVTKNWNESTLNFNNQPLPLGGSLTGGAGISITSASFNQFVLIDITSQVQSWLNSPDTNKGLALALDTGSTGNFFFDAKESLLTANGPELEIALSGTGQQGPPGPQGPQGPAGPLGPVGATGPQGPKGDTGTTGAQGPQGLKGDTGAIGGQGPQGAKGDIGATGAQGPTGSAGPQGPQGIQGPPGIDGQQGAAGPQGPQGPSGGLKEQKAALMQWYRQDFPVGDHPQALAFDGAYIWVANSASQTVQKLRATDGICGSPCAVTVGDGITPLAMAFDGANIWVTTSANTITKLRASDGLSVGTYAVGQNPVAVLFDGANIWVANKDDNNVSKLRASDGVSLGTFPAINMPTGLAFDGLNVLVSTAAGGSFGMGTIQKLRATDGVNAGREDICSDSQGVAFDGADIWIACDGGPVEILGGNIPCSSNCLRVNLGLGQVFGLAFDGADMWVASSGQSTLTRIRPSDRAILASLHTASSPRGVVFDGGNVWVANWGAGTVSRF